MLGNEKGRILTLLLYLFVFIFLAYMAVKTVPAYMGYYSMDDEVAQQLRLSTLNSDEVIIKDLNEKASEHDIELDPDGISVTREEGGRVAISIKWTARIDYGYGFARSFPFVVEGNSHNLKD